MSSLLPDTPTGVAAFALTALAALLGGMHVAGAIRRLLMIAQDLAKLETRFWSGEPGLDVRQLSRSDGIAAGVLAAAIKEVDRPTGGPAALHARIGAAARVAVDRALLPFASMPAALNVVAHAVIAIGAVLAGCGAISGLAAGRIAGVVEAGRVVIVTVASAALLSAGALALEGAIADVRRRLNAFRREVAIIVTRSTGNDRQAPG